MTSNPIFRSLATNAWKSMCMTIPSVFLQTIKSIQHCIGIECCKILRFPKRCERKHIMFFKMWFTNACPPHVLVYFHPLPHPTHQVVTLRSSMTLVAGMPLWLGVILHEGTTFLVARILSISVGGFGHMFFGMFTSKIGHSFFCSRRLGK